jgi:hypothetical protein
MEKSKYGKYIVTEVTTDIFLVSGEKMPEDDDSVLLNLDDSVVKGAFLVQASWTLPSQMANEPPVPPHKHDFNEVLAQVGTDLQNPHDLGAELEIWLGGEKHIITKSCIIFIPKGLEHGPIKYNRIDRPIFHFICGAGRRYK